MASVPSRESHKAELSKGMRRPSRAKSRLLGDARRVGVEHLQPLGEASASLSLIAVLVLGLCLTVLLDYGFDIRVDEPSALKYYCDCLVLFMLCCSSAAAVYTSAFSLLELYYTKTVYGLDLSISLSTPAESMDAEAAQRDSLSRRIDLATDVDTLFESLTAGRKLARNTMWTSLMCLLGAAIFKLLPLFSHTERPAAVAIFACGVLLLLAGILSVPLTVLRFRREYWALMGKHMVAATKAQSSQEQSRAQSERAGAAPEASQSESQRSYSENV